MKSNEKNYSLTVCILNNNMTKTNEKFSSLFKIFFQTLAMFFVKCILGINYFIETIKLVTHCNEVRVHWYLLKRAESCRSRGQLKVPHLIVYKF